MIRRTVTSLLFVGLVGAAPATLTSFTAPAGDRQAGAARGSVYGEVLPSGRIIAPVGTSVPIGMSALGVALSPDGRYAVVTNDDERETDARNALDPRVVGGYSLAVVDTKTMRIADVYVAAKDETFFLGVAALRDPADPRRTIVLASEGPSNAVRMFELTSAGKLVPDGAPIPMPLASNPQFANNKHAFPGGLTLSRDGTHAYIVNNLSNTVTAVDLQKRVVLGSAGVGFFPYGVAVDDARLIVTDEGLSMYGVLPQPVRVPSFANVAPDSLRASALSIVPLSATGDVAQTAGSSLAMDAAPDGEETVGGAHPSAIVTSRDGRFAYVAMTNVDRIATVSLTGVPRVIGGLQLRLFDRAPYGTQPSALALSRDGKILYAALSGINAVALIDARNPAHLHRVGLIPTGWYPTALALSADNRYLYIVNQKGYGHDPNFQGGGTFVTSSSGRILQVELDSNAIWSTLQRIDLRRLPVAKTTMSALQYLRRPARAVSNPIVPPLRSLQSSSAIKHVVLILEENKTYDSMLGDLKDATGKPHGDGDPSLVAFDESVTPNLHALAREFGLAANEYADAEESDAGHQFASAGITSDYSEKTLLVKSGRTPLVNKNEDPEDYPRAGYIFNSLMHGRLSYRDYGDLVRLSGYDEGRATDLKADDPQYRDVNDQSAPTSGLGGLFSLDVPAPFALAGHVDLNYPGWNLRIRDMRRAKEFVTDYGKLVAANAVPQFTHIWLPADHGGRGPGIPALPEEVADGDRALGTIVDYISHLPTWNSTAIFIMPDDSQSTRDHVSEHRSYVIVVSPYAKRHYVGRHHISTVSVLKTEEELLGLPALSLGDLLATDMSDFFSRTPDVAPFSKIAVPVQSASPEGSRIAGLLEYTDQSAPDADVERSAALIDLSRRADRLAATRNSLTEARYAAAQELLYQRALRVIQKMDK